MSKGINDLSDPDLELGNLEPEEMSTNQQTIVLPVFAGEAKFALKWLSDPFNQFVRDAPMKRPGKK